MERKKLTRKLGTLPYIHIRKARKETERKGEHDLGFHALDV